MAVHASPDLGDPLTADLGLRSAARVPRPRSRSTGSGTLPSEKRCVRTALARQPDRVVLDLSRLTFMDATGVHGVLDLANRAARLKVNVAVIPGPPAVQRLFEICELRDATSLMAAA